METLLANISAEIIFAAVNALLLFVIVIITINNSMKIKRMKKRYNIFMEGISDRSMEQLIDTCLDGIKSVKERNKEIENKINHIERNLFQCIQKVGVVRYNAFENVGSDLSYSIAMLDNNDNGVVISSIYSRDTSTTYAKPIEGGKSKYPMSAEEMQAIDNAKRSNNERIYVSGSSK